MRNVVGISGIPFIPTLTGSIYIYLLHAIFRNDDPTRCIQTEARAPIGLTPYVSSKCSKISDVMQIFSYRRLKPAIGTDIIDHGELD